MGRTRYLSALLGQAAVWPPPSPAQPEWDPPPRLLFTPPEVTTQSWAPGETPLLDAGPSSLLVSCSGEKTGGRRCWVPDGRQEWRPECWPWHSFRNGAVSLKAPVLRLCVAPPFCHPALGSSVPSLKETCPQQRKYFCCPTPPPLPQIRDMALIDFLHCTFRGRSQSDSSVSPVDSLTLLLECKFKTDGLVFISMPPTVCLAQSRCSVHIC